MHETCLQAMSSVDVIKEFKQLRPDTPVPEDAAELSQTLFEIIHALQVEVAELRARVCETSVTTASRYPRMD